MDEAFLLIAELSGLTGAVQNNPLSERTEKLFIESLALLSENASPASLVEQTKLVIKEKFTLSPGCASCKHACGNTSALNKEKFFAQEKTVLDAKLRLIEKAKSLGKELEPVIKKDGVKTVENRILLSMKCIAALNWNESQEVFEKLLEEN